MTLKHKNKSKWARRILERGLNAQDEGTRAAMAEQLHHHALLTRKINTVNGSSSNSESSSDEDDDGSDEDRASELLENAKVKTLKVLEDDEELPNSGVLSLPFMVRGMKKRKEEAIEEAKLSLEEYEQLEGKNGAINSKPVTASGRRVFGRANNEFPNSNKKAKTDKMKVDNYYGNSGSEDDLEAKDNVNIEGGRRNDVENDAGPNYDSKEATDISVFKMKNGNGVDTNVKKPQEVKEPTVHNQDMEVGEVESDSDSGQQMVDGILSSGPKESYELPSQAELIQLAFAADDVAEEFEKDKQEILNEENPEPDKPVLLPGWGQWTDVQQKKKVCLHGCLKNMKMLSGRGKKLLREGRMHILSMSLSPKRWIKRPRNCKQKLCPTLSHPRNFLNKVCACRLDLNQTQRLLSEALIGQKWSRKLG